MSDRSGISIVEPRLEGEGDHACWEILREAVSGPLSFLEANAKARIEAMASLKSKGRKRLLAVDEANHVIGFVDISGDEIAYLFVRSDRQRMGVGRALFDAAQLSVGNAVRLLCFKRNRTALQFYLAIGCQTVGERDGVFFGSRQENYLLVREPLPNGLCGRLT